jgi:Na+-transporting NADH:ubiquinone oxidoreductase subunit NqrC
MSIQRKFLLAVTAVIACFALVIALITVFTTSSAITQQIVQQKKETADRLNNILTVTDAIMLERVKSSMALLKLRGAALGSPRQSSRVTVKSTQANELLLGTNPQANNFCWLMD